MTLTAACSTVRQSPRSVTDDLARFTAPDYPPVSGVGSVVATGRGKKISGTFLLALDGPRYRLELMSRTGVGALAVAGDGKRIIKINPATGQRSEKLSPAYVEMGGLMLPSAFLRSMVSGAAPTFDHVVSVKTHGEGRVAKVAAPSMELYYSDRLNKIVYHGRDGNSAVMIPGKITSGPMAPYISSVTLLYGGARVAIEWIEIRQGVTFPEGFFEFNEPLE